MPRPPEAEAAADASVRRLFGGFPAAVYVVAIAAALIPLVVFWHSQAQTPDGWRFTGNLSISPDLAQYRSWIRQTQVTGILVDNRFTAEPNQPYIPVPLFYAVGKVSSWTGLQPEFAYVYTGAFLSFLFVLLLFGTVRTFFPSGHQCWWVFLVILIGGGLGAHLKVLSGFRFVQETPILRLLLIDSIWSWPLFEDYRSHYVFLTLFDPHFILIWLLATASAMSLYLTLDRYSAGRVAMTSFLYAASAFVHFYEGPLLLVVTACVALLCWVKRLAVRPVIVTLLCCVFAVAASNLTQVLLYRLYGLPASWVPAVNILVSTLFISYPIGWVLIAVGLTSYWRDAGLKECFLLGWLLGCTLWTLSGPFNPFPDRGTMTMQVPIYLIGAGVYFSRRPRVAPAAALVVVALLGVTPLWMTAKRWKESYFTAEEPFKFMSAEHDAILKALNGLASDGDVLLADAPEALQADPRLWLGPEYIGRHFCGHWFLCVDYATKKLAIAEFFLETPEKQASFLKEHHIRFLFVDPKNNPQRFTQVPTLVLVKATSIGSLFEHVEDSRRGPSAHGEGVIQ